MDINDNIIFALESLGGTRFRSQDIIATIITGNGIAVAYYIKEGYGDYEVYVFSDKKELFEKESKNSNTYVVKVGESITWKELEEAKEKTRISKVLL